MLPAVALLSQHSRSNLTLEGPRTATSPRPTLYLAPAPPPHRPPWSGLACGGPIERRRAAFPVGDDGKLYQLGQLAWLAHSAAAAMGEGGGGGDGCILALPSSVARSLRGVFLCRYVHSCFSCSLTSSIWKQHELFIWRGM